MKILYASERPPYPFFTGGAARSAHNMLTVLASNLSCSCLAIGSRDFKPESWTSPGLETYSQLGIRSITESRANLEVDCGYPVQLLKDFPGSLRQTIAEWKPDIVWTQLEGIELIASIGLSSKTPTIVFLRDAEDPASSVKAIARSGAAIICNSQFMADRVQKLCRSRPHVIYPSFVPLEGTPAGENGLITMINPHRVKGLETFLEITRRMPDQRFLIVESWPLTADDKRSLTDTISAIGNIEYSDRVPNIEVIYKRTKLLVVPSVWEEAFGRVVIEAESLGIPVVASARGGLPEAVGKGGVCIEDYLNAEAWVKEIRELLDAPMRYRELSTFAHSHARSEIFSTHYAAQSFLDFAAAVVQANSRPTGIASALRRAVARFLPASETR